MSSVKDKIMDAVDLETFIVCKDEEQGRKLALQLMQELGFNDVDIVFIQFYGPGVKVRSRAYIHRSGDMYGWLTNGSEEGECANE